MPDGGWLYHVALGYRFRASGLADAQRLAKRMRAACEAEAEAVRIDLTPELNALASARVTGIEGHAIDSELFAELRFHTLQACLEHDRRAHDGEPCIEHRLDIAATLLHSLGVSHLHFADPDFVLALAGNMREHEARHVDQEDPTS